MAKQADTPRDPFSISLGGMTTVAAFAFAPAIASDRLSRKAQRQDSTARATSRPSRVSRATRRRSVLSLLRGAA